MFDDEPEGATLIDPDQTDALLQQHLHTRDELNLWEQQNILGAAGWALRAKADPLDEATVRELHRRMFDQTWAWAGRYRTSDTNIGVPWPSIPEEVGKLVDDGRYWLENGIYSVDEGAVRLHHRLVKVHPFTNGNGRHGRLWADMILEQNGRPPLDWRNHELDRSGDARGVYIMALRAGDE